MNDGNWPRSSRSSSARRCCSARALADANGRARRWTRLSPGSACRPRRCRWLQRRRVPADANADRQRQDRASRRRKARRASHGEAERNGHASGQRASRQAGKEGKAQPTRARSCCGRASGRTIPGAGDAGPSHRSLGDGERPAGGRPGSLLRVRRRAGRLHGPDPGRDVAGRSAVRGHARRPSARHAHLLSHPLPPARRVRVRGRRGTQLHHAARAGQHLHLRHPGRFAPRAPQQAVRPRPLRAHPAQRRGRPARLLHDHRRRFQRGHPQDSQRGHGDAALSEPAPVAGAGGSAGVPGQRQPRAGFAGEPGRHARQRGRLGADRPQRLLPPARPRSLSIPATPSRSSTSGCCATTTP